MSEPKFYSKGEHHPLASLSSEEVRAIKALGEAGMKVSQLTRASGIPYHTVYSIVTGRRWAHLELEKGDLEAAEGLLSRYKHAVAAAGSGLFAEMTKSIT